MSVGATAAGPLATGRFALAAARRGRAPRLSPFLLLATVLLVALVVRLTTLALPLGAGGAAPPAPPPDRVRPAALELDPARWRRLALAEPAAGGDGVEDHAAPAAAPASGGAGAAEPGLLAAAAAELQAQREALQRRTEAIELREIALRTTVERLEQLLAQLDAAKAALAQQLEQKSKDEEARIAQLVKVYETMKAKRAAQVFDGMPLAELMPIIRRMRDAKVAAILQEMTPARARELTQALARPIPDPPLDALRRGPTTRS
jgi:flagellar motility protein MotE (MotC chaperone)